MQAVHAWRLRPWYRRAWFTWPGYGQAAALAALTAVAVVVALFLPSLRDALVGASATLLGGRAHNVTATLERTQATIDGARMLWQALFAPVLGYAAAFVILMYVACAAVVFALNRALFGKVLHS
jgi:hypothetical protein